LNEHHTQVKIVIDKVPASVQLNKARISCFRLYKVNFFSLLLQYEEPLA